MSGGNARDNNNKESRRLIVQTSSFKRNQAEWCRQMCIASHISSNGELLRSLQLLPKAGQGERKSISSVLIPLAAVTRADTSVSSSSFFFKGQLAAAVSHFCHNQKGGDLCKAHWLGSFQAGLLRLRIFSCKVSWLAERRKTNLDAR